MTVLSDSFEQRGSTKEAEKMSGNLTPDDEKDDKEASDVMTYPYYGDEEWYEHQIDEPVTVLEFSASTFEQLFEMSEDEARGWIEAHSTSLPCFDFASPRGGEFGDCLAIFYGTVGSGGGVEVFELTHSSGPWPERWQIRDDYTSWFDETAG